MKTIIKVLGLIVLLGGVIFAASCSKDSKKTCECTVSATVSGQTVYTETVSGEIESGDCSDAEDMPEIEQAKQALGGYGSINVSCREI
jgi:hypothetical protein